MDVSPIFRLAWMANQIKKQPYTSKGQGLCVLKAWIKKGARKKEFKLDSR